MSSTVSMSVPNGATGFVAAGPFIGDEVIDYVDLSLFHVNAALPYELLSVGMAFVPSKEVSQGAAAFSAGDTSISASPASGGTILSDIIANQFHSIRVHLGRKVPNGQTFWLWFRVTASVVLSPTYLSASVKTSKVMLLR